MGVDTTRNYSLATDDEEYPQGFSDAPEDEEEDENYQEEKDSYDFPDDTKDGLFDPMEAEK